MSGTDFSRALLAGVAWIASTQIQREEIRRAAQWISLGGAAYFGVRALRSVVGGVPILGEVLIGGDESAGDPVTVPGGWSVPIPKIAPNIPPPPQLPPMAGELLMGPKTSAVIGRIVDPQTGGTVSRPFFGSSVEIQLELANWAGTLQTALVDVVLSWSGIGGPGVAKATHGPYELDGRSSIRVPVKVHLGGGPFSPWIPKTVSSSVLVNGKATQTSSFEIE